MKNNYPRLIIAGTQSGVGKTTITLGILAVLKKRGMKVQPFKVGPDYIDTAFHSVVAECACRNLDSYLLKEDILLELFERAAKDADYSVVEGVMGLFDGAGIDGRVGSTAHVASIIKAPVVLVVDVGKMAHSVAALVNGFANHSKDIYVAGCIVNGVKSERHYQIVKNAIEKRAKVKVLGYLRKDLSIVLPQRHLGLQPVQERKTIDGTMQKLVQAVEETIDIDALLKVGLKIKKLPKYSSSIFACEEKRKRVRIAYAFDECFHFYYQDNLDILAHYGAELVKFSPLKDDKLPSDIDGVYIGGGFPEMFSDALAADKTMRECIKKKSSEGVPVYAECGGLIYLMKAFIAEDGETHSMVGVFNGKVTMAKRLQNFGYHKVLVEEDMFFASKRSQIKGHVFHWSYVNGISKSTKRVFSLRRGGQTSEDGYLRNNTLASYVHIHFGTNICLAKNFIRACAEYKMKGSK